MASDFLKKINNKKYVASSLIFLLIILALWRVNLLNFSSENVNYKDVFGWLNKNLVIQDRLLVMCLPDLAKVCSSQSNRLVQAEQYFKPKSFQIVRENKFIITDRGPVAQIKLFRKKSSFNRLFAIVEKSKGVSTKSFEEKVAILANVKVQKVDDNIILVFSGSVNEIIKSWFSIYNFYNTSEYSTSEILIEQKLQQAILSDNHFDFMDYYEQVLNHPNLKNLVNQNDVYAETVAQFFQEDRW